MDDVKTRVTDGAENWFNHDGPIAIIACVLAVPAAAASGGWYSRQIQCGGFVCDQWTVFGRGLLALAEPPWSQAEMDVPVIRLLANLWDEEFADEDGLSYGVSKEATDAYVELLRANGLSADSVADGSSPVQLKQAVYPIDATDGNLTVLTDGRHISVTSLLEDDPVRCGAVIIVIGQNRD